MATRKTARLPEAASRENELTGEKFDAMTDQQRAAVVAEIEAEAPAQRRSRSKPLNAEERAWWRRAQKKLKAGRPRFGKSGTRNVSVTARLGALGEATSRDAPNPPVRPSGPHDNEYPPMDPSGRGSGH